MVEPLLIPQPKQLEPLAGNITVKDQITIAMQQMSPILETIIEQLESITDIDVEVTVVETTDTESAFIKLLPHHLAPEELLQRAEHPEGYGLVIDGLGITIYACTDSGYLYAAMTMRQLFTQFGSELPHMRIGDAPDLPRRGSMLSFAQGHTEYRESYMEYLVPRLARWKINELYLYIESYFQFPSFPHLGGKGAMTPNDVRKLEALCNKYQIKLIPQINVLGHCGLLLSLQKYHHLGEFEPEVDHRAVKSSNLCVSSPEVWELTNRLLTDIMDCFESDLIHVGGDEVSKIGICHTCQATKDHRGSLGLYLDYLHKVQAVLQNRGRKMGIWGDMLLHHMKAGNNTRVEAFVDSNQDQLDETPAKLQAIRESFKGLVQDTVIYDWHYSGGAEQSLRFFVESGFETVACNTTHLVYTTSMWPAQTIYMQELYADAHKSGAQGGMTTAWCNFAGLHEEQFHFFHAVGGALLWSRQQETEIEQPVSKRNGKFYTSYLLQHYGFRTNTLSEYWHVLGDAGGPVLKPLSPYNGSNPRRCLFYTDNVLKFWKHYSALLQGEKLISYRQGIKQATKLWKQVEKEMQDCKEPYLHLQKGPLLIHQHLLRRFEMTEEMYELYDAAAKSQYTHPEQYKEYLHQTEQTLLRHLENFPPIEAYIQSMHEHLGTEISSQIRLEATKVNIVHLAEFLQFLMSSERPLPAFYELHDMFLQQPHTNWFYDREHEWADAPASLQRYGLHEGPWHSFGIIEGLGDKG